MNANAHPTLARLPHFAGIDASNLLARLDALLDAQRARIAALTAAGSGDWEEVVTPMEEMADELHRSSGWSHLHNVADTDALRAVYTECVSRVSAFGAELEQNAGLCAAYQRLRAQPAFSQFDDARRKLVDNALRDFRLGGVDLPAATQAEVTRLKVELAQLAARYEGKTCSTPARASAWTWTTKHAWPACRRRPSPWRVSSCRSPAAPAGV